MQLRYPVWLAQFCGTLPKAGISAILMRGSSTSPS